MAVLEQLEHRRFTSEEILRMVEGGILDEDEHLELLEGELIVVSPQNPQHAALAAKLQQLVAAVAPPNTHLRLHSPIAAGPDSLPEPDLALVRGRAEDYLDRHPAGGDVLLVVEIAVTSQAADRLKVRIYGKAGVPIYWLLDLPSRRLEVHTGPLPAGGYAESRIAGAPDSVSIPGTDAEVAVSTLLP
jgi:Uma2 family endonuclease